MNYIGVLESIPLVGAGIRKTREVYRGWKLSPRRHIGHALRGKSGIFVVQIGSNDGIVADPIRKLLLRNRSWEALLIEPVPFVFQRLRRNYPVEPRFRLENLAIADATGGLPFYYLDEAAKSAIPDLPVWYDQLGSFDRNHIFRHFGHAVDRYIVTVDIPTASLADVLNRHDVTRIDLLHIDTEGSDWMILRQLDLSRYAPAVILFEYRHLSAEAKHEALQFLEPLYQITDLDGDYFCRLL